MLEDIYIIGAEYVIYLVIAIAQSIYTQVQRCNVAIAL